VAATFTNFGRWLHESHHRDAQQIGTMQSVLGLGEFVGCMVTMVCSDRVGYKRGVYVAGTIAPVLMVLFAGCEQLGLTVWTTVGLLVAYFLFREFTWISGKTRRVRTSEL
jgi:predicted MFS family arabinose efflux permease